MFPFIFSFPHRTVFSPQSPEDSFAGAEIKQGHNSAVTDTTAIRHCILVTSRFTERERKADEHANTTQNGKSLWRDVNGTISISVAPYSVIASENPCRRSSSPCLREPRSAPNHNSFPSFRIRHRFHRLPIPLTLVASFRRLLC